MVAAGMLACSAAGAPAAGAGKPTAASVDAAFQAIWTTYHKQLRGLCVGAVDGGISRTRCFGRKAPGSSAPPNAHTLFHIASISKTFGATLLALRVEQGKVRLDDRVRKFVANPVAKALFPAKLTLLDLADHYSGLPHSTPSAKNADAFLLETGLCFENVHCRVALPRSAYHYSNWAVSALGTLLALDDGFADGPVGPWSADNRQSITGPLGMTETRSWQDWLRSDPAAFAAQRAKTGSEKFTQSPYESPGSGVWSSPHDMLIWLRYSMGLAGSGDLAAAQPLLFDSDHLRAAKKSGQKIGLVWTRVAGTGGTCVSKAGDGGDFHAFFVFLDKQRRGVFLLVNKTPKTSYRKLGTKLLNSLPAVSGTKPPRCPISGSTPGDDG